MVTEFSMKIGASTAVAQERGSKAIDLGWGHNYIWRVVVGWNVCVFVWVSMCTGVVVGFRGA